LIGVDVVVATVEVVADDLFTAIIPPSSFLIISALLILVVADSCKVRDNCSFT
jgi:hypothetical protein